MTNLWVSDGPQMTKKHVKAVLEIVALPGIPKTIGCVLRAYENDKRSLKFQG